MTANGFTAVISDFGGVLTTPLIDGFLGVEQEVGVSAEQLGLAMQAESERSGAHPLFELEMGRVSEADFLAALSDRIEEQLGRRPALESFRETFFAGLTPNDPVIERMATLRTQGFRMALLTNNVREWEPLWRAMFPVEEIFEVVVDSAFVGMRKPDPAIYELTLERLGLTAAECVFVDDIEHNCDAARELGITPVHFRDADQALAELTELLG